MHLQVVTLALQQARLEITRLGQIVECMLDEVQPAMLDGRRDRLLAVARMDEDADHLHGCIIEFLGKISRGSLTGDQTEELMHLMAVANAMEAAGDVIELRLSKHGLRGPLPASFTALTKLEKIHLEENGLNGTLPPFIWSSGELEELVVSKNEFTELPRSPLQGRPSPSWLRPHGFERVPSRRRARSCRTMRQVLLDDIRRPLG